MNKKQRRYNIILFLFIFFIITPSFFVLAEELSSSSDESDIKIEQKVNQDADEQKQTQLKEYFRGYYYKQGTDYFKKGRYPEAMAKFKRALYWWPEYEPALRYMGLIEDKIAQSQKASVSKEIPPEAKIEEAKTPPTPEPKKEEIPSTQIEEYRIDIGDVLDISVWKVPDLSQSEVIVRPDGKISLPLIGDVETVGLSLTQLDDEITKRYALYVRDPQVSVMIRRFGGRKVVVLGEVAKPGVYTFTSDIRLIEVLALAGDCTKYAVRNNVLIIRGDIHKNPTVISSNILAFLKDARLSENVLVEPQDVIFVPRSLIGNINAFLETISPIIDGVYKGASIQTP